MLNFTEFHNQDALAEDIHNPLHSYKLTSRKKKEFNSFMCEVFVEFTP